MTKSTVQRVEEALRLHINYGGNLSGGYLKIMDRVGLSYAGRTQSEKVSNVLDDYYKTVDVKNLKEALDKLRARDDKDCNE